MTKLKLKNWWHHLLYADVIKFLPIRKSGKVTKIAKTGEEHFHIFLITSWISMNFSEKNITYNNIKSHKKPVLYLSSKKHNFGKSTRGWGVGGDVILTPQPFQCYNVSWWTLTGFIISSRPLPQNSNYFFSCFTTMLIWKTLCLLGSQSG